MHRRSGWALALLASFGAAVGFACGSSSDDGGGGGPDASPDDGVDVVTSDASAGADTSSVDAISGDARGDVDAADAGDAAGDASDAAYAFDGDAAAVLGHQLGTGGAHSCAIRAGGAVRCWGSSSKGQLGNGSSDGGSSIPVDVVGLTDAVELAAGGEFTCARRASGSVRCWGDGRELGVGPDAGASSVPVDVTGLTDAVQLAAGSYHACALRANKHVVCWGSNYGRIGDGTVGDKLTPTEPIGPMDAGTITDAISVGAGWGHTCIAHENGTVTCSGEYQPWGQLGDGTTADRFSPVLVQNMSTARAVGLGLYTSYALLASGQLQSWGNNQLGQLGIGTSDQSVHGSPVDVPGMTNIAELAPSGWGSCALTQTRQGYCWGDFVSTSMSPTLVTTSGPIAEISGGESHACARMISGEVQCWGSNYAGQLGAGVDAGATSATPVTVPGL